MLGGCLQADFDYVCSAEEGLVVPIMGDAVDIVQVLSAGEYRLPNGCPAMES